MRSRPTPPARSNCGDSNQHARTLQLALQNLERAPIFDAPRHSPCSPGGAGKFPAAAVPPLPAAHDPLLHRRLRAGADPEALTQSLADLVKNLGVAAYESDYIRTKSGRISSAKHGTLSLGELRLAPSRTPAFPRGTPR